MAPSYPSSSFYTSTFPTNPNLRLTLRCSPPHCPSLSWRRHSCLPRRDSSRRLELLHFSSKRWCRLQPVKPCSCTAAGLTRLILRNMCPSILLPAILIMLRTNLFLFPVTHRPQLRRRQPQVLQKFFRLPRPRIAQRQVIFIRTAFIAETLHCELISRIILQNFPQRFGVCLQSGFRIWPDSVLIVVEIDVLNTVKQALNGCLGGRIRRGIRRFGRNINRAWPRFGMRNCLRVRNSLRRRRRGVYRRDLFMTRSRQQKQTDCGRL